MNENVKNLSLRLKDIRENVEIEIDTPMGSYYTSWDRAEALLSFFKDTETTETGATGGQYSYIFTPTNLGTVLVIKDCVTGKEFNVTDYNSW